MPPGAFGKKITVRACDADGVQSGPVKKVSPKELRLEPLPAPPAPLRLAPWCVNCGNAATLRCMACGSSICGIPWGGGLLTLQHRPDYTTLTFVQPSVRSSNGSSTTILGTEKASRTAFGVTQRGLRNNTHTPAHRRSTSSCRYVSYPKAAWDSLTFPLADFSPSLAEVLLPLSRSSRLALRRGAAVKPGALSRPPAPWKQLLKRAMSIL